MLSAAALTAGLAAPASAEGARTPAAYGQATLTGFASLPAETFVPGSEPSGSALGTAPDQRRHAAVRRPAGPGLQRHRRQRPTARSTSLSDNGYGNKANSADFVLRIHRIAPDFRTGTVDVLGGINLTDPTGHVPFPLTRADRVLTGADFDVESIVRAHDGTYWMGDEFGPFLLHFDRAGRLLDAPVPLPGVFAPENPSDRRAAQPRRQQGLRGHGPLPDGRTSTRCWRAPSTGDTAG